MNKAGYTPVMLAALTAAERPDDLEVAQQLLKLGDVNGCSRQVIYHMCLHWHMASTEFTDSKDLLLRKLLL